MNWLLMPIEKLLKWNSEGFYFPINHGRCDYLIMGMDQREIEFFEKLKKHGTGNAHASRN